VLRGEGIECAFEHDERELALRGWSREDGGSQSRGGSRWWLTGSDGRSWVGVLAAELPLELGPLTVTFTMGPRRGGSPPSSERQPSSTCAGGSCMS
jgi:hypothetical protein